jgi:predicted acetyltransferase
VTVSVRDARSSATDRQWIEGVYRDYLDDLSPLNTGVFSVTSLGEIGYSESDQLDRWFGDSSVNPLLILRGTEPVGFAMVARGSAGAGRAACDYRMAEFFVTRNARRRGIGRLAVELILNRFAGRWEITEYLRNPVAVAFWRRVVANYTHGSYQERVTNGEVRQSFESGISRAQKPVQKPTPKPT